MRTITVDAMAGFGCFLKDAELAARTVENYLRHVRSFAAFAEGRDVSRELAAEWKNHLRELGRTVETVNGMLVSLNRFFEFVGWVDCRVKQFRVQHKAFRAEDKELTQAEISLKGKLWRIIIPAKLAKKLLKYAKKHKNTSV